ncbi:MAG: iron-sulfur cluster assembly scaffold protein [Caulobacterales bacterium]|nr:iron-sulfur cluster assembly scaffold protein [Caulobacterales bacterium]
MDIYSSKVFELSTTIKGINKTIDKASLYFAEASKYSKLCGSEISLGLIINPELNVIIDFTIIPKACALGQASASVLSNHIIGAKINEIYDARTKLFKMLKEDGPLPEGRFWELRYLENVKDYKMRHASVMLAWDAAIEAIEKVQLIASN